MAKVSLSRNRPAGPLLLRRGGQTYALTAQEKTEIPLSVATNLLGDTGLIIEFTKEDENDILELGGRRLDMMLAEFNVKGTAKDLHAVMFPKKKIIPKKKTTPKVVEPKEEPKVEAEKVEEKPPAKKTPAKKTPATKKKAGGK